MKIDVKNLLKANIDTKFDDKLFWYASKIVKKGTIVKVFIENQNLVTFDNTISLFKQGKTNIKKISELISINQKVENIDNFELKDVLVSAGTLLFINNKLLVTKREETTTFDPGHWTTPAGRCDRTILETSIKETVEEIEVSKNEQIFLPDLAYKFNFKSNKKQKECRYYKTYFESNEFALDTFDVELYLDGNLLETTKSWFYYSNNVNTLEFRVPIFAKFDEIDCSYTNNEFGTKTGLKTLKELKSLKCVPALKKLIEEIYDGKC